MAISSSSAFFTSPVFLCHASECHTEWMSDIAWNRILNFSNFYLANGRYDEILQADCFSQGSIKNRES